MLTDFIKKKHHYGRYKIVKGLVSSESRNLIDIGCGSPSSCMKEGSFLRYLGYGQGMDIEPRDIQFPFTLGNIMDIPFKDKKFDVVTAIEVMEHVDDPVKALHEVHRILKDGGTFVMTTPDNHLPFRIFWFFWERTFGRMWYDDHETYYTRKQWLKLISSTRLFKIVHLREYWGVNVMIKLKKVPA